MQLVSGGGASPSELRNIRAVAGATKRGDTNSPNGPEAVSADTASRKLWGRARRSAVRRAAHVPAPLPPVVDDWPASVPVTSREVDVVETYLGSMLQELLSAMPLAA